LDEAYESHKQQRYASTIAMVLTQIDGIFMDMTGKPLGTVFDPKNRKLLNDQTLAGHPLGLRQLSQLMSEGQRTTSVGGKLSRNGILHGRILGYGSLLNATKLWAALLVVIEAVGVDSPWYKGPWPGLARLGEPDSRPE